MTFFNKKTEVMQIEMTPYGRYLYSIGKFKPHSYEFVDDDILYRASGSTEVQEAAHSRIINETPKLKINRAYQDEGTRQAERIAIDEKRVLQKKMTQRQNGLSCLGRSSYSSDNMPSFQVTMLQGTISGSSKTFETNRIFDSNKAKDISGSILIPQIDIEFSVNATVKNVLDEPARGKDLISPIFSDGRYIELSYVEPIIHIKEFNSFYEKENFEIEVFLSGSEHRLDNLKLSKRNTSIVNDLLVINDDVALDFSLSDDEIGDDYAEYFFDIETDMQIPQEILCQAIEKLEINNQFLDEELICPDQRTERFNIYGTRVRPSDLEDCEDE
jgi:hypothetical protein